MFGGGTGVVQSGGATRASTADVNTSGLTNARSGSSRRGTGRCGTRLVRPLNDRAVDAPLRHLAEPGGGDGRSGMSFFGEGATQMPVVFADERFLGGGGENA